jgi:heme-degrading monooxygenase HmoA
MHARLTTYTAPDIDKFVSGFQGAGEALSQIPGQAGAFVLVDRESGKALTLSLWETQDALQSSREGPNESRDQAIADAAASVESIAEYEVPIVAQPTGASM